MIDPVERPDLVPGMIIDGPYILGLLLFTLLVTRFLIKGRL